MSKLKIFHLFILMSEFLTFNVDGSAIENPWINLVDFFDLVMETR